MRLAATESLKPDIEFDLSLRGALLRGKEMD